MPMGVYQQAAECWSCSRSWCWDLGMNVHSLPTLSPCGHIIVQVYQQLSVSHFNAFSVLYGL